MKVSLIGAGGHACTVRECVEALGAEVQGLYAEDLPEPSWWDGVTFHGSPEKLSEKQDLHVAFGFVTQDQARAREQLVEALAGRGCGFVTLKHPQSEAAPDVNLEEGVFIARGVLMQTGVSVGRHSLINTGAILDHHVQIGAHCHVAPGAVLCGGVTVGAGSLVGAGAVIKQGVSIGSGAVVAAGAVLMQDLAAGQVAKGIPAR